MNSQKYHWSARAILLCCSSKTFKCCANAWPFSLSVHPAELRCNCYACAVMGNRNSSREQNRLQHYLHSAIMKTITV